MSKYKNLDRYIYKKKYFSKITMFFVWCTQVKIFAMPLVYTIIFLKQIVLPPGGNAILIMIKERSLIKNLNLMILNRIILIYGIAFDGFPWESYFLASILVFLHQKVLSRLSVHTNTYNSPWQGPPGGITIENNVEIKKFKSIYLWKKKYLSKIPKFCLRKPVISKVFYQWTKWYKKLFLDISYNLRVIMLTRVGFIEKKLR